ncbi:MAG TPA: hydrogenase accessory protein HypB [Verrucomicrobia bacterium]|nr:MAG: hydrogenase accessory protein HypB [Lentisphaerae bacterium GWF2_57_35]HBA83862.1 hydrogenase accessory protein HypB [Verrucomicrobiota bacterium]
MCDHCGCSEPEHHQHEHVHPHEHEEPGKTLEVRRPVLEMNARLAERNRGYFKGRGLYAINLLSSPGSGKTSLIERTLMDRGANLKMAVVVGDLQTENDANRIRRRGAPAVQITTGEACHLDAHMVAHALEKLELDGIRLLFIENVGNLVCPASFDLGENTRVVLHSVTEGEDKPLKYPVIFHDAELVVINKIDLAAAVGFDRDTALANIRRVAPSARILELSAKTGEGTREWYEFLEKAAQRS